MLQRFSEEGEEAEVETAEEEDMVVRVRGMGGEVLVGRKAKTPENHKII